MLRAIVVLAVLAICASLEVHVCCGCGDDASATPRDASTPLNSLSAALDAARALRRAASAPSPTRITVSGGPCAPPRRMLPEDGGSSEADRVTIGAAAGAPPAQLFGGVAVLASWLEPVTDAGIIAQLQPAARGFVQQIDLSAHGILPTAQPLCHAYMGGEAAILPGNLVSAGMEFFAAGDPTVGGDFSPLDLARYPNHGSVPKQWSSGAVDGYVITPDAATGARVGPWKQQLQEDPGSIFVHYLGGYGTIIPSCGARDATVTRRDGDATRPLRCYPSFHSAP